ncbi:high molecular mass nuclear antigen, putative [Eimeria mitis]|uniref:High molecular mass nuclear antigen, putative n=1 Tax=Eimeria mitis TaxID=44415 RepID=U6K903_9EIME|nr:high molecular mass nuclear antigen, putative [Eimeria mitis]CDJ32697.1 high molecular mass nuclear antigen, putative [Eimeria mitis]
MTLFNCDDICPLSRRHVLKRVQCPPTMRPVTYANAGSAPFVSHYVSYPLHTAFNMTPQKASPSTSPVCSSNYVEEMAGLGVNAGVCPPLACLTGAPRRVQEPVQKYACTTPFSLPPEDIVYVSAPYSAGDAGKLAEPRSLLKVPEPGTQCRGNFKDELPQPRAVTSPAGVASRETGGTHQHELQQEVKRLQAMLNARENQLDLKEAELQDALSRLQSQRKRGDHEQQSEGDDIDKTAFQEKEAELKTMRKRVEVLRRERQDLMELLLQKERQTAILEGVDPSTKEASALQLGVQAISMVQGASELRGKLELAEAEIKKLRADREAVEELQQDTFEKLTDKRKEAAELLELLSQRDMKVARIEAYLQQKTRELEVLAARSKEHLQKEQSKREEAEQEYRVAAEQCNAFKATLANRDEKLMQLQAEVVRRDTLLKQLEERVRVLSDDLTGAHSQLQQVLKAMAAKDAYMQELEAQLRKNDTERQLAYLTEVSKSRKLAVETRIQQELCRAALNDKREKLAAAKQDLFRSESAMERIRKAIGAAQTTENCYVRSAALQSPELHSHSTAPLHVSPAVSAIPSVPVEHSLRTMDADFVACQHSPSNPPPVASSLNQLHEASVKAANANEFQTTSRPPMSTSKAISSSASRTSTAGYGLQSEHFCPPYSAVQEDPLDRAVAHVCESPEYRSIAPHICRLGPGTYLCCMSEVSMELEPDGSVMVLQSGMKKLPIRAYLDTLRSTVDAGLRTPAPSPSTSGAATATAHSKAKNGN